MKKLLLLSLFMLGFSNFSFAQANCAGAIEITANGTITVDQITGTYIGNCVGGSAATTPNAMWYKYTPSSNGEITISSDLPQNDGTTNSDDTRVSIITTTGACSGYACYGGSDDVSGTNFTTTLTFPVSAGVTYYIVWDDRWSDLGFDFDFAFSQPSCIRPNDTSVLDPSNVTSNSASLSWSSAIGNPSSYDVEYGDVDFTQGSGTVVNSTTTSVALSALSPASSNKDYYLRSNCGATQSSWAGPFRLYLAATCPFSNNFDNSADYSNGFSSPTWGLGNATGGAQSGTIYYFSNSSTTAVTNANLFSRAISLQANEEVTLTFYTRLGAATGSAQTLRIWVNGVPSLTGATQLGANITVSGTAYVMQTRTYTASTAGTYYFIFNNATPIITTTTSLRLDTVNMTSTILSNDQFLASSFDVYPNPAKEFVTISNNTGVFMNNAEIIDLNGRIVKTQKINNVVETQINLSDLSKGVYMLKIYTDKGSLTKKLIKE